MFDKEKYSHEYLQKLCSECFSYRQFAEKLGYSPDSNNRIVKNIINKYDLDISHFKGQGWNKDSVDLSIFRYNNAVKSDVLIRALTLMRGWKCEKCEREEWEGQKIPLCVHHIDGVHINNELDNLQVLCPNCHAQTDNYCGRNKAKRKNISDEEFVEALRTTTSIRQALQKLGIYYSAKYYYEKAHLLIDKYNIIQKEKTIKNKTNKKGREQKDKKANRCLDCNKIIRSGAKRCEECSHKNQCKVKRPSKEELFEDLKQNSFCAVSRKYGVTDNAVRKWCRQYNLPDKASYYKNMLC